MLRLLTEEVICNDIDGVMLVSLMMATVMVLLLMLTLILITTQALMEDMKARARERRAEREWLNEEGKAKAVGMARERVEKAFLEWFLFSKALNQIFTHTMISIMRKTSGEYQSI